MSAGASSLTGSTAFQILRVSFAAAGLAALSQAQAPQDPRALAQAASKAMSERRFPDAVDAYQALANQFPDQPMLQANLGMALHMSARDGEAIAPLRSATVALPDSFPAHFFLGASLTRMGSIAEAVTPLTRATEIDRSNPHAHAMLADALEQTGDFARALKTWQHLGTLAADNPFPYAGMVRCHEELAADALETIRSEDPESPYLIRLLGHTRLAAAQYSSSLFLFREALQRQPNQKSVHEAIAEIYKRSDNPEWAAIELDKAAALPSLNCTEPSPECLFHEGKFDEIASRPTSSSQGELFWSVRAHGLLAAKAYERLAGLPDSRDKLALLADLLAAQGDFARAADFCRKAIQLAPQDDSLDQQLAELLFLARRTDEARPLLERLHESAPRDPRWPAMLGSILSAEQEHDAAIALLLKATALGGAPPSARLDLGRSLVALGRHQEAVEHLEQSRHLDDDGSVHYQLAQAYQRLEMGEKARAALQAYRELDARNQQEIEASAALEITPP